MTEPSSAKPRTWEIHVPWPGALAVAHLESDCLGEKAFEHVPVVEQAALDEYLARIHSLATEIGDLEDQLAAETQRADQGTAILVQVRKLLDDSVLVRNISRDHESDWAIRALPVTRMVQELVAFLEAKP